MTVGELKKLLEGFEEHLPVMMLAMGVNGWQHEDFNVKLRKSYTREIPTANGWTYERIQTKIVEIS